MILQYAKRVGRRDGHCENKPCRLPLTQRDKRSSHRCAGGDAVINHDDRLASDGRSLASLAKACFAPPHFLQFTLNFRLQVGFINTQSFNEIVIEDIRRVFAVSNGADRQFRLLRRTELAHHLNIQRRIKRAGDLSRNRHTTSRQPHNHRLGMLILQMQQHRCKLVSCILTIAEPAQW